MKTLRILIASVAAAAFLLSSTGCATLLGTNAAATVAIQGGIEFAVGVYIQHKGNNVPATEAAVATQITSIANELEAAVNGNLTVAQFNAALQPAIAKLSPAEQILATELMTLLDGYFAQLVANKGSILNAQTSAAATVVLNDVIAACAFYTQSSSLKAFKA